MSPEQLLRIGFEGFRFGLWFGLRFRRLDPTARSSDEPLDAFGRRQHAVGGPGLRFGKLTREPSTPRAVQGPSRRSPQSRLSRECSGEFLAVQPPFV